MFSGIIECFGLILDIRQKEGKQFEIKAPFSQDLLIGESVAINGVCQTVIAKSKENFQVSASSKTLEITNLDVLKKGEKINLERSLQLGDRLSGHFVYGHVDQMIDLINITSFEDGFLFSFAIPKEKSPYILLKGSVTINGVSLTVYEKKELSFSVVILPHTYEYTTFSFLKEGEKVNIEFDVFGKYVKNFVV